MECHCPVWQIGCWCIFNFGREGYVFCCSYFSSITKLIKHDCRMWKLSFVVDVVVGLLYISSAILYHRLFCWHHSQKLLSFMFLPWDVLVLVGCHSQFGAIQLHWLFIVLIIIVRAVLLIFIYPMFDTFAYIKHSLYLMQVITYWDNLFGYSFFLFLQLGFEELGCNC